MGYRDDMFRSIKAPCKECEERYPGCHDHCEGYKQAQTEWLEFKKDVRKKKRLRRDYDSFKIEGTIRSMKHGK